MCVLHKPLTHGVQTAPGIDPSGVLMLLYALGRVLASAHCLFHDYFSWKTLTTACYKYVIMAGIAGATIGFGAWASLTPRFVTLSSRVSNILMLPHPSRLGLLPLLDARISEREIYPMFAGGWNRDVGSHTVRRAHVEPRAIVHDNLKYLFLGEVHWCHLWLGECLYRERAVWFLANYLQSIVGKIFQSRLPQKMSSDVLLYPGHH
jgi:hypothetical protein